MTAHTALRASYSIDANVLRRFNDTIPAGERSKIVQSLMEQALLVRERTLEQLAEEFENHPDFAQCRETVKAFDVCSNDGLEQTQHRL
jgi:hypothetical protein